MSTAEVIVEEPIEGVEKGSSAESFIIAVNDGQPGIVKIAMAFVIRAVLCRESAFNLVIRLPDIDRIP